MSPKGFSFSQIRLTYDRMNKFKYYTQLMKKETVTVLMQLRQSMVIVNRTTGTNIILTFEKKRALLKLITPLKRPGVFWPEFSVRSVPAGKWHLHVLPVNRTRYTTRNHYLMTLTRGRTNTLQLFHWRPVFFYALFSLVFCQCWLLVVDPFK